MAWRHGVGRTGLLLVLLFGPPGCSQSVQGIYFELEGGATCAGACVPHEPLGWSRPLLLWTGSALAAPECPDSAPAISYEGHGDLIAPAECTACTCEAPTGACALSTEVDVYNAGCCTPNGGVTCPANAIATSFDAPAGWGGACTTANAIPGNQQCGGVPCVQTAGISPPIVVMESACTPGASPVLSDGVPAQWGSFARACLGEGDGRCEDPGQVCAPTMELTPPGFAQCIWHDGEAACPETYPERRIFFDDMVDNRGCTPCACEAPEGGGCSATVSLFSDSACSSLVLALQVETDGPMCHAMASGSALRSKSAMAPVYKPGACPPSGGEPLGFAEAIGPSTFCCLP